MSDYDLHRLLEHFVRLVSESNVGHSPEHDFIVGQVGQVCDELLLTLAHGDHDQVRAVLPLVVSEMQFLRTVADGGDILALDLMLELVQAGARQRSQR